MLLTVFAINLKLVTNLIIKKSSRRTSFHDVVRKYTKLPLCYDAFGGVFIPNGKSQYEDNILQILTVPNSLCVKIT